MQYFCEFFSQGVCFLMILGKQESSRQSGSLREEVFASERTGGELLEAVKKSEDGKEI